MSEKMLTQELVSLTRRMANDAFGEIKKQSYSKEEIQIVIGAFEKKMWELYEKERVFK